MTVKLRWSATVVLALAGVIGCEPESGDDRAASDGDSTAVVAPADSAVDAAPAAFTPIEQYVADGAQAHGLTRAQVIARFGPPTETISDPVLNRHDPSVTDSVVQLVYPGARYTYYVVTAGPGEILDGAEITANEHLRHRTPGIGTSAHDLRAAYGEPVRADGDELEYDCRTCEVPQPVTFVFRDGRVERIRFDYYVD